MKDRRQFPESCGFTRLELLALLGALGLLTTVVLPALAGTRRGSDRAACVNNLRQIGRAYQVWASDHNDDAPHYLPISQGGIMQHPLAGNAWFQFSWISNELATPRILACPSDPTKLVARDFSRSADGGFLNAGYCNNAVSYFVGLHAIRFVPGSFLTGDRNVQTYGSVACSAVSFGAFMGRLSPLDPFWTNNLHGLWGNLLTYDGQVRTVSNQTMTDLYPKARDPGMSPTDFSTHFLMP